MPKRLHIYVPSFAGGGAERVFIRLANALADAGSPVSFMVNSEAGPLRRLLADRVPLVSLGAARTRGAFGRLVRFIARERPEAIICALTFNNLATLAACRLAPRGTRVVICERNQLSHVLAQSGPLRRRLVLALARRLYPRAHAITAVSGGVARDLSALTGVPLEKIAVIRNPPPDDAEIAAARAAPAPHPWFESGAPVMVAVGRLHPQKRYDLLLRALAQTRRDADLRLIVLGEGAQQPALEALAAELGVSHAVCFAGFVMNRLDYLVRARLYALTSDFEGFPNALVEAVACGTPVVSADCAGDGASEILRPTLAHALVPTGDVEALVRAIRAELAQRTDARLLAAAARDMSLTAAAQRYLALVEEPAT